MAALEIKVPPVGESISEVTIGTWFKNEGDIVKMDEVICGLDSDKATFELTAEIDGVLHIKAQEGDTLAIGDLIATIDPQGAGAVAAQPEAKKPESASQPTAAKAEEPKPAPAAQPAAAASQIGRAHV